MTNIDPQEPSIGFVNANPTKDQLEAALRQIVLVIAPLVAAAGFTKTAGALNGLLAFSGIIATLIVLLIGQLKTRALASKAAQMAKVLPDHVAQVK